MPNLDLVAQSAAGQNLQYLTQSVSSAMGYLIDRTLFCLTTFFATLASFQNVWGQSSPSSDYFIGLAIADITGPVVETNMMGYASLAQTDTGLHMRQRARAAVIAEADNPANRVVFLNIDTAMGDSGIRRGIIAALQEQLPGYYDDSNVAVVGTHQHSGVGGYLENLLPQITSLGFVNQTYQAIVTGSVSAIVKAHNSLAPAVISLGNTTVLGANRNRSPYAYLNNPPEERARYEYDQDKTLTLMRFDDPTSGNAKGFLAFFAVHGTSLYENNTLVSGDNKGMAAYLAEHAAEPDAMPGQTDFVAIFSQSNVGDTSPNTLGAYCESPGEPWDGQECAFNTSTCGGRTEDCHGRGPGFRTSDFYSNYLIGQAQHEGAQTVMNGGRVPVSGSVRSVHQYINMANYTFTLPNGTDVSTCPAALGFSFAAGTTDGPGAFDFTQGTNSSEPRNPFWDIVKGAITPLPSQQQVDCQYPKPILLDTGVATEPYPWSPNTVNIQILRVGQLVILVIPGEFTTMSGRRIREAMRAQLIAENILDENAYVVIAGPANTYSHYIATLEEYAIQRYEGASTLYGQYTLQAYMDIYSKLTGYIADNPTPGVPPSAPAPPDLTKDAISLLTPVIFDSTPFGKSFGQVLVDVESSPYSVNQTVSVQFVGANPRNNLRLEGTFLTVEQSLNDDWTVVRTDSHPSTTYQWAQTSTLLGTSAVIVNWTIEAETPSGSYRIRYFGDNKPLIGSIGSFVGVSGTFTVA